MGAADKRARREARQRVDAYYLDQLADLIGHVEESIAAFRAGKISASEVDETIHQYHKASQKLWSFCWGQNNPIWTVNMLEFAADEDHVEPDWWEQGAPRRRD